MPPTIFFISSATSLIGTRLSGVTPTTVLNLNAGTNFPFFRSSGPVTKILVFARSPIVCSKLLGDPVGPTPFLIEAEDNDDGVGARNVFFQWLQAYLSGIVLTAQNNRRDLGFLQRLGHDVLKLVAFRLTDSCIRAHDGKLLRPFARLWCDVELAADVSDERVDVFRMD